VLLLATVCHGEETKAERDARMAWWREAKFGMFIHWGVYSVPAGFYHDQPVSGIGEWIMNRGKIPMAEYQGFAKEFNPVKFNADEWVKNISSSRASITTALRCSTRKRVRGTSCRHRLSAAIR
jgi:alpha-L-fucosidase